MMNLERPSNRLPKAYIYRSKNSLVVGTCCAAVALGIVLSERLVLSPSLRLLSMT